MSLLTLSIGDPAHLQHGVTTCHQFDRDGGTIGSHGADWLISDREQHIQPIHCEIRWIEGSFCAIDRCGKTYLNGNLLSLGNRPPVRLNEGDCLKIGSCQLHVHHLGDRHGRRCSVEELLRPEQRLLDAFIKDSLASTRCRELEEQDAQRPLEICGAFAPGIGPDPLAALDATFQTEAAQGQSRLSLTTGERP